MSTSAPSTSSTRRTQIAERKREAQRLHKALEDTGIKLDCVATDILGKSGRAMFDALVKGTTDPEVLADLALGKMRKKIPRYATRAGPLRGVARVADRFDPRAPAAKGAICYSIASDRPLMCSSRKSTCRGPAAGGPCGLGRAQPRASGRCVNIMRQLYPSQPRGRGPRPQEISPALERLADDPAERRRLDAASRRWVLEHHSHAALAQRFTREARRVLRTASQDA
ncbi:MAG: hypothetical protein WKF96_09830 [Solirubrobacteraceae bacterium]